MESLNGIIGVAVLIIGSAAGVLILGTVGYILYVKSGQERGE